MAQNSQVEPQTSREKKRVSLEAPRSSGIGGWLITILFVAILAGGVYFFLPELLTLTTRPVSDRGILTHTIGLGRLLVTVTEDGNVESASNLDVKCMVKGGTSIQWIIPDGTNVEKDDELVKLDQATIEEQLNTQKIAFEKAQASKIQADEDHGAAVIGVKEYQLGTFLKDQQLAEAAIRIAMENLKSAENMLFYTQRMARRGFATPLQAEADKFAVERGKLDLAAAETSQRVLVEFTKEKMLKELEAKRETAAARVHSEEASFNLEKGRLDRLQGQLTNCVIKAPQKGMVVYANEVAGRGMGGAQSVKVEEGATVREGQTLIRLPDLGNMQVKVIVHESKVELIKSRMPGRIKIGDRQLDGTVVFVASQPEPASWMTANVKEYATTVKIEGEMSGLKPGMTAEVEILIEDLKDVPLIPVSAVVEQRGKFFAWVKTKTAGAPERRQLTLGRANDKVIHVVDGVKFGDEVLLNPRAVVSDAREEGSDSDKRTDDRFKKKNGSATKGDAKSGQPDSSSDKKPEGAAAGSAAPGAGGEGGGDTAKKSAKRPQFNILSLDKDGDKKVSRDEASAEGVPPFMSTAFDFMDTNKDGFIDAAEVAESRKRMQQGGGGRPGGPGGAPAGGGAP